MAFSNAKARHRTNRVLVELRLNAGLTPNDLARRAGISGNTGPRSQFAIARALGVQPLDVFPFERQRAAA